MGLNMWSAVAYGIYGFIVAAVFVGAWAIVTILIGILAALFGGRGEDDEDE